MDKSYCQSLNDPISDDPSITLEDTIPLPENSISDNFTKETISKALNCLNPREYKVVTEFYGLNGVDERPIKDIAKEMGLGDERIRQIRKGAIKKLDKKCGNILRTLL